MPRDVARRYHPTSGYCILSPTLALPYILGEKSNSIAWDLPTCLATHTSASRLPLLLTVRHLVRLGIDPPLWMLSIFGRVTSQLVSLSACLAQSRDLILALTAFFRLNVNCVTQPTFFLKKKTRNSGGATRASQPRHLRYVDFRAPQSGVKQGGPWASSQQRVLRHVSDLSYHLMRKAKKGSG